MRVPLQPDARLVGIGEALNRAYQMPPKDQESEREAALLRQLEEETAIRTRRTNHA